MNYTVSGMFLIQVEAANRAEAKEVAEKMLRTSSKARFYIIEIEEGEPRTQPPAGQVYQGQKCGTDAKRPETEVISGGYAAGNS